MGNRAYIVFPDAKAAIYVHWNGGIESVVSFLDYANEVGIRGCDYGVARMAQIIGNYFGGTLSVGVRGIPDAKPSTIASLASEDNGAFVIGGRDVNGQGPGLRIVEWVHQPYTVGATVTRTVKGDDLDGMVARARQHAYNITGEMLDNLRKVNDPIFHPTEAEDRKAANVAISA